MSLVEQGCILHSPFSLSFLLSPLSGCTMSSLR